MRDWYIFNLTKWLLWKMVKRNELRRRIEEELKVFREFFGDREDIGEGVDGDVSLGRVKCGIFVRF